MSHLHSYLISSSERPWPGILLNGDPRRPGDPTPPAGNKPQQSDNYKPDKDYTKYVSPTYDDEEDEEDEDFLNA